MAAVGLLRVMSEALGHDWDDGPVPKVCKTVAGGIVTISYTTAENLRAQFYRTHCALTGGC